MANVDENANAIKNDHIYMGCYIDSRPAPTNQTSYKRLELQRYSAHQVTIIDFHMERHAFYTLF